jgi:hypothetical protein
MQLIEAALMARRNGYVSDFDDSGFEQSFDKRLAQLARAYDGKLFIFQHRCFSDTTDLRFDNSSCQLSVASCQFFAI